MPSTIDDGAYQSRIGPGAKISGKLSFRGRTTIEGEADGEIRGEEIVIAQSAIVTAKISGTRLSVAGRVNGELVATERVELLAGARAKCTISSPRLVLNEGAQFDGECKMPRASSSSAAVHASEPAPMLSTASASGDQRV
jgi:cytoskeletal protein CcmA (bactofilin family)